MRERVGFPRAGARDDEQRTRVELRGFLLLQIQHERYYTATFALFFARASRCIGATEIAPYRYLTYNSRSATGIGRRAARIAGNRPPINPIKSA